MVSGLGEVWKGGSRWLGASFFRASCNFGASSLTRRPCSTRRQKEPAPISMTYVRRSTSQNPRFLTPSRTPQKSVNGRNPRGL
jgi:hypothetical protein